MRISGGAARGITLLVPRGDAVRPATDGLRQALFSSLGPLTTSARFLDLFAGSGAYGLEALSRGAEEGVFVEHDRRAADCLRQNIAAVCKSLKRGTASLEVRQADVMHAPLDAPFGVPDLVFIDPPYELIPEISTRLFERLAALIPSGSETIVILEAPGELELAPQGWSRIKQIGRGAHQPTANIFKRT